MSIASWTSPPASALTFPISCVISSASSALRSRSSSAKRNTMPPRSGAGTSRQSANASAAARTARSTSAAPDRGSEPSTSPVAGLTESKRSPDSASTHSPPMKFAEVVPVAATTRSYCRTP